MEKTWVTFHSITRETKVTNYSIFNGFNRDIFHRDRGPIELESFRNDMILECDNKVSYIKENWYIDVSELFVSKHKQSLDLLTDKTLVQFHKAVDTLMSNQVCIREI